MKKTVQDRVTTTSTNSRWWRIPRLRKFRRSEDGMATLEFSLVAIPFFLLTGAIFEVAINYFVGAMMDHGVSDLARRIRTNQFTAASHNEATIKQELCNMPMMAVFDCSKLVVDVQQIAAFADPGIPRDAGGSLDSSNMGFSPGGPKSINVLRVYYEWPVFMAFASYSNANLWSNGKRLIVSSDAFVIEP